jgi:hypothetical protein
MLSPRSLAALVIVVSLALAAGCDDGGSTSADVVTDTASDATPTLSYATVKPIYAAKCTPCHTGGSSGGHNIGSSFASADVPASLFDECTGKTKAECSIVLIKAGIMPFGAKCTGDPALDTTNSACLTKAEQDLIQSWVDAGTPE